MGIEMLVYCPPMEEGNENVTGWDKETIAYVAKNKSKVYSQIRGISKGLRKHNLQPTDVDDIYSEVLMYLYSCDDYNLSKAIERSSSDKIVSLEGYLNTCIKYCVVRHCTLMYKDEKEIVHDVVNDDDGKELSILDNIADSSSKEHMDTMLYDLEALCRSCEAIRYKYGPDIYLVWFVRLLTLGCKNKDLYKDILSILGISKKELSNVERYANDDELLISFAKAVDISGVEESIKIIRPYVFSYRKIENAVHAYS